MGEFSATAESWVTEVPERIVAVRNASVQDLADIMTTPVAKGGRMRVDTGFLRASLTASTTSIPLINPQARPADGQTYLPDNELSLVIAGAGPNDSIFLGFVAAYAAIREFGPRGQPGDAFVGDAVLKWQPIVDANVRKLGERLGR